MKKFFSIVCALAIVLSASAVPTKKLMRNAKFVQNQELRQQKTFGALLKDARVLKGEKFAKATALRAPQAKKEAIDVTIGSWDIDDWGTDGELMLIGADNTYAFYFDLIYGGDNEDLELGKTYTVDDIYIGADGMYGGVFYDGDWHYGIKSLSLVKTVDEQGLVHFAGSTVDSLDAAFTFHYDEEPFVPAGDTITYAINANAEMSYSSWFLDWTIKADDGVYAFQLDIYSENTQSPVGVYTNEDFDLGYTYVEVYTATDASNLFKAREAKATITAGQNDSIFIAATILAEDGVVYELNATYAAPKKEAEATITASNLAVTDTYASLGIVWAEASNDDYAVYVSFGLAEGVTEYAGTYTIGDDASGDVTIFAQDSAMVEFYSGTVTLAKTEAGWALTGTVLAYNNTEYTLNLTYVKPDKTREETITIDGLSLDILDGAWQISGYNASGTQYVSIAAYADAVAGTYTEADLAANYSYVVTDITSTSYNMFSMVEANLTITYNEATRTATVTGTFLGQNENDVPLFTLNLSAVAPEPSPYLDYDEQDKDFLEVFETYEVNDKYLSTYGDLIITASNENGARAGLDMYIGEGETTLTPGQYAINDSEDPMTVYPGSCNGTSVYYSFLGYTDAEGYITDMWFPVSGTITVSETGVISIDALNSYGKRIIAQLGQWPEGIENTEAAAVATKRIVNGQLVIEKNGVRYNAVGTVVK